MKTRTIIVTFEIEDNDFVEQKLFDNVQCDSFKDFKALPDTSELYKNDSKFIELVKSEKKAKKIKNDYINKQKLK